MGKFAIAMVLLLLVTGCAVENHQAWVSDVKVVGFTSSFGSSGFIVEKDGYKRYLTANDRSTCGSTQINLHQYLYLGVKIDYLIDTRYPACVLDIRVRNEVFK